MASKIEQIFLSNMLPVYTQCACVEMCRVVSTDTNCWKRESAICNWSLLVHDKVYNIFWLLFFLFFTYQVSCGQPHWLISSTMHTPQMLCKLYSYYY